MKSAISVALVVIIIIVIVVAGSLAAYYALTSGSTKNTGSTTSSGTSSAPSTETSTLSQSSSPTKTGVSSQSESSSSETTEISSQTYTSVQPFNSTILSINSDPNHMYLEAVATFFSHGKYYAFYNDANATYAVYSPNGTRWSSMGEVTSTANAAVAYDTNTSTVYVISVPNDTNEIVLTRGSTNTPSGAINWSGSSEVIYNATLAGAQVKLLGLQLVPSTSLTLDNFGNLWISVQTMFFQAGEQLGFPLVNYSIIKVTPSGDANNTSFSVASGFPYLVGSQTSHNYGTASVNIVSTRVGVSVVSCNVKSALTNSSAYLETFYNQNESWGSMVDLPFQCGYNFSGQISSIIAASSPASGDNVSILYFSAAVACNACEYKNTNVSRIIVPLSPGPAMSLDQVDGNISGGFVAAATNGSFVWTNSQIFGAYSGTYTYYVGELGSTRTTSGILLKLGGAWSIVGSSATQGIGGGLQVLYSVLTNATAGGQGAYSLGFAIASTGQ
ncbi:MAG TPA: hypothetical protein VFF30_11330 [Nitrososphaerales archaeon]|nr:hypothetical protein [Nitrososphaerales archaeon]